jgi:tetraacyldisaccharide 4'-kinase
MPGSLNFRDLVSGRRRGIGASLARGLLRVVEVPYTLVMRARNDGFDRGWSQAHQVGVPVLSVGNLTLGGTGKTPMVKWIARRLRERGVRVAIVSRGYGAKQGKPNDEALELAQALPDVPHVQNRDRVAGALQAAEEFGCQLVLLDDGFQHRRLARDLDIVLLDATAPFGFDHVFPRGELREPVSGLQRADVVCLTRADQVEPAECEAIRQRVARLAPQAAWCQVIHAPSELCNTAGQTQPLESLRGQRVAAFCGIGNPAAFRQTLESAGCQIVCWREFPDHHAYNARDQSELERAVAECDAQLVLTTHKDLVKLATRAGLAGRPLWAVLVEMQIATGGDVLEQALSRVAPHRTE